MIATVSWPAALIFDLDGTLVDSAPDIAAAVNEALAEHRPDVDAAEVRDFIGDGAKQLIERVFAARDIEVDADALASAVAAFHAAYHARPCEQTVCYEGVHEMLTTARTAGRRLAVCTNKPQAIADQVLQRLGIRPHVEVLVGAGTYRLKPDPEPLRACLDALQLDTDNAVYIGDMRVDRLAGEAAGLPVVLARFGYANVDVAQFQPDAVLDAWPDWPIVRDELETRLRADD